MCNWVRVDTTNSRSIEEESRWGKSLATATATSSTSSSSANAIGRRVAAVATSSSSASSAGGRRFAAAACHHYHPHQLHDSMIVTPLVQTTVPTSHRIDVQVEYKSNLYKTIYWRHPNMAITREFKGQEEFIGEFAFYNAHNSNVIVNFFTGLDTIEPTKLRFAHVAHTPPECRFPQKDDYLRKNMELLMKKIGVLQLQREILESIKKE